jgi:hypothetical protein
VRLAVRGAPVNVLVWAEGIDPQELVRRRVVRVRICGHDGGRAVGTLEPSVRR